MTKKKVLRNDKQRSRGFVGERGGGLRLDGVRRGPSRSKDALRMTIVKQATTGPSTAFGAECAPNSAQDDS